MKYIRVNRGAGEMVVVNTKNLNKKLRRLTSKFRPPPDDDLSSRRTRRPL